MTNPIQSLEKTLRRIADRLERYVEYRQLGDSYFDFAALRKMASEKGKMMNPPLINPVYLCQVLDAQHWDEGEHWVEVPLAADIRVHCSGDATTYAEHLANCYAVVKIKPGYHYQQELFRRGRVRIAISATYGEWVIIDGTSTPTENPNKFQIRFDPQPVRM